MTWPNQIFGKQIIDSNQSQFKTLYHTVITAIFTDTRATFDLGPIVPRGIRVHRTFIKVLCSFIFFSLCFWKTIMLNTSLPNTIDFVNYYLELKQFVEYFNFSIFWKSADSSFNLIGNGYDSFSDIFSKKIFPTITSGKFWDDPENLSF